MIERTTRAFLPGAYDAVRWGRPLHRLRTTKTKGCLSRMTALTMVFRPCQSAAKKWRRLDGSHQIADIIQGVKFKDGEKIQGVKFKDGETLTERVA